MVGEGQIRKYTGKDGVDRKAYSIVVSDFDFCGSKGNGSTPKQTETTPEQWKEQEEDVPF